MNQQHDPPIASMDEIESFILFELNLITYEN